MNRLKSVATVALLPWFVILAFLSGPVRWELAHAYDHLVQGLGTDLPLLTLRLSMPVLDAGSTGGVGLVTAILFWSFVWLGASWLIVLIWRSRNREDLMDRFVFGAAFYFGSVFLLVSAVVVGLWLPFFPLSGS